MKKSVRDSIIVSKVLYEIEEYLLSIGVYIYADDEEDAEDDDEEDIARHQELSKQVADKFMELSKVIADYYHYDK